MAKVRKRPHFTFTFNPEIKQEFQDNCYMAGLDMSHTLEEMMIDFNKVYDNLQKARTQLKARAV